MSEKDGDKLVNGSTATTKKKLQQVLLGRPEMGTILPLAVLMIAVAFINPSFFSAGNLLDVLRTASFSFMIAVPLTFLIAGGGIDLSIGAATSFGGVICAFCLKAGMPIPVAILVAVLAGALVGGVNGLVIVKAGLPGFLATLGLQYALNGIILVTTQGVAVSGFSAAFKQIGQFRLFGIIPLPVIYALVIGIIGHVILIYTKAGRSVLAIGGNKETAHLAGINVNRYSIMLYVMTSLVAALSGVILASRFATAQPAAGTGTELTIMAAVIIGGTSMYGGTATVFGAALGCILLAAIQNVLIVIGVSIFWQNLVFGLILLISLFVDKYRRQINNKI